MSHRDPTTIARLLAPASRLLPDGVDVKSSPLLPSRLLRHRLAHFDPEVYDLSGHSHLYRFMAVLLGDAGAGMLRRHSLLARLAQVSQGANFYDLDRFYGAIFGASRGLSERLSVDPDVAVATSETWEAQAARDGSYRSRLFQLAQGFNFGATRLGLKLAAEALFSIDVDIHEIWRYLDDPSAFSKDVSKVGSRREVIVRPQRILTADEHYSAMRVLNRLKPSDSIMVIEKDNPSTFTDVSMRGLHADSEHWEVVTRVVDRKIGSQTPYGTGSGGIIELPRPPMSGYRGEMWSYHAAVSEVDGYTDVHPDRLNFSRVQFDDPSIYLDYLPRHALLTEADWLAGRMSSDGASSIHPLMARVNGGTSLYLDRISVADILRVRRIGQGPSDIDTLGAFWATPERAQDDPTIEYLEVIFTERVLLNRVLGLLPAFPHEAWVEVWINGQWVEVGRVRNDISRPATLAHFDPSSMMHPQHRGAGHWLDTHFEFPPRRTDHVRVGLRRGQGDPPHDREGRVLDYSLGLRGLEIGYQVRALSDIPSIRLEDGRGFIASTRDVLDTRTEFHLRTTRAEHLLVDDDKVWRSEPMPMMDAVVNLYVDTRDANGEAKQVSHFYVEPMTEGVTYSIYHSDDIPTDDFEARHELLPVTTNGTIERMVEGEGEVFSLNRMAPAWVDISTGEIQFDPERAWWFGIGFFSGFASSDGTAHPLVSFGVDQLQVRDGTIEWIRDGHEDIAVDVSFARNARVGVIVAYLPESNDDLLGGWHLIVRVGSLVTVHIGLNTYGYWESFTYEEMESSTYEELESGDMESISRPNAIRIGGSFTNSALIGGQHIRGVVLKEASLTSDEVNAFFASSRDFVLPPEFDHQGTDYTVNSTVRWSSLLLGDDEGSLGIRGGPPNRYAGMHWVPAMTDARLTKGFVRVPSVPAKFWKFEFTSLVAEPFEMIVPLSQGVKTHPSENRRHALELTRDRDDQLGVGNRVLNIYELARSLGPNAPVAPVGDADAEVRSAYGFGVIEALVADSPEAAARLRASSWLYGWEPYHQQPTAPSFSKVGKHLYEQRRIQPQSKVAFYVGLRRLLAFKADHFMERDDQVYQEYMYDTHMTSTFTWRQLDEGGWVADAEGIAVTSRSYLSHTKVEGVQFAAEHTGPVQLLPDPHFHDPALNTSDFTDPDEWHFVGDVLVNYRASDRTVLVRRFGHRTYGDLEVFSYEDLEDFTYGGLETTSVEPAPLGGLASPSVMPSESNRYHAAVRIIGTEVGTPTPVWVQIVNAETGEVLAERRFEPTFGEITHAHVGYTEIAGRTYGDVETLGTYGQVEAFTYGELERQEIEQIPPIRAQVVQKDNDRGSFRVASFGIFDASVTFEFSPDGGNNWYRADDIANNPHGVLVFGVAGNQLRWRAKSHRSNVYLHSMQIRPRYVGRPVPDGFPERRGGNSVACDIECPIHLDPEFQRWSSPIPQWWYLLRRSAI